MTYYTKEHEWITLTDGKLARVGITDHAQDQLGDIVFIDFTADLADIDAEEEVLTVESVKSVSDVYAPVAGKVVAFNDALDDSPELVNDSPTDEGWMFEIEVNDPADLEKLMNVEQYQAFLEEEE